MKIVVVALMCSFALTIIASIVCFGIAGANFSDADVQRVSFKSRLVESERIAPLSTKVQKWLKRGAILAAVGVLLHFLLIAVFVIVSLVRSRV